MQLVILAEGMGSRFGGLKQMEKMDEAGNFLLDYSIYDAKRAGFSSVVFIIKKAFYEDFKNSINLTYEQNLLFDAVFMYGYDYRYIADNILNCTERTVKSKMKKLLEKL